MKFKVHTIPHTMFAAWHLVNQLNDLGHDAELVSEIDLKDLTTYIIYHPKDRKSLPKNYIVYQTEIGTSHWFKPEYFQTIAGAIAVWDYSINNVFRYQMFNKNISIVTPGVEPQELQEKDIPVTFYGWIEGAPGKNMIKSERRKKLLSQIGKQVPINIVTNSLGNAMWEILRRTKVVLNIHFYDNSPLEVFRINEALSFGCQVVSEPPAVDAYKGLVQFASGPAMMIAKLKECLNNDRTLSIDRLNNREEIKKAIADLPQSRFAAASVRQAILKV